MARLGIDFGTTNTVVTVHDRGMFSVVLHQAKTRAGTIVQELYPSAILIDQNSGQHYFGIEADRRFAQLGPASEYVFIPSLKRKLRDYAEGKATNAGGEPHALNPPLTNLLTGFLRSLADSVRQSRRLPSDEPLETVITWPANANGAQRHVTRRCFREAGFKVIGTLNEPTASAIELADCLTAGKKTTIEADSSAIAVFDLGGGTFDASVVWVENQDFRVLASTGIETLGGDDFDHVLLQMFLDKLQLAPEAIGSLTRHALLYQARSQKETISTGAIKSLFFNPMDFGLDGRPLSIPVNAYYKNLKPLVAAALEKLREVIETASAKQPQIKDDPSLTIYLVGGSSKLPLVAEMVSEAFPKSRVVLTDKPFRSAAMGAAICAMDRVTYREVFARNFGIIRLRDHGQAETFDTIFPAGTPVPRTGEPLLEKAAWYHPRHNIGHMRYLECTTVGSDGMPAEGVRTWSDILFPYDPAYPLSAQLSPSDIAATDCFGQNAVCEVYRCDHDGVITVELRRPFEDDARCYEIYRD